MDAKREMAWIGDAVLALWARSRILERNDIRDAQRTEAFVAMTSNRFLAALGDPTSMESRIGEVYKREGLDAVFAWMDTNLLPVFEQQWKNLQRGRLGAKP